MPPTLALFIEILRGVAQSWRRYLWPGLAARMGLGPAAWVFFHQIFTHHVPPFSDPLQNQHQSIGWIAGLGGIVELARRSGLLYAVWAGAAWPVSLVGIGVTFSSTSSTAWRR